MVIPEQFMSNMRALLPDDFDRYAASFSMPAHHGIRVNTLKCSSSEFVQIYPDTVSEIPFVQNGFYYEPEQTPAKNPYYYAGLYYIQEPSAMLPADRLPVEEGDYVLDLCAAPGGKSTALLGKLKGAGFLVANDISYSRCQALLKNLEYTGGSNFFVCAEDPNKLAPLYTETFHKILVDAPCSGEGMFRKDPSLVKDWESKGPAFYAPLQAQILENAYRMLRPGGMLLYSTCTFSPLEDEENILKLLENHKDLSLVDIPKSDGMAEGLMGLKEAARVFPHRVKGEGHFLALVQKENREIMPLKGNQFKTTDYSKLPKETQDFLSHIRLPEGQYVIKDGNLLFVPAGYDRLLRNNIRYLRTGLLLGEIDKGGRLKPDTTLALSMKSGDYDFCVNLPADDERAIRYLKGESIDVSDFSLQKGIILVCIDTYPLGFAKNTGNGLLKNLYRAGWRMQ